MDTTHNQHFHFAQWARKVSAAMQTRDRFHRRFPQFPHESEYSPAGKVRCKGHITRSLFLDRCRNLGCRRSNRALEYASSGIGLKIELNQSRAGRRYICAWDYLFQEFLRGVEDTPFSSFHDLLFRRAKRGYQEIVLHRSLHYLVIIETIT